MLVWNMENSETKIVMIVGMLLVLYPCFTTRPDMRQWHSGSGCCRFVFQTDSGFSQTAQPKRYSVTSKCCVCHRHVPPTGPPAAGGAVRFPV